MGVCLEHILVARGDELRILLPILVLATLVAGCSGGLIRPKVEKGIRNALPNYIGPARQYTVRADGSSTAMLKGFIERLHIEGEEVEISSDLVITRMSVDMDEVRYDTGARELQSVRSTTFQAEMSEDAVNRCVEKANDSDFDLNLRLKPGEIWVDFVPNVVGVNVPVSIAGRPVIVGGNKVNFEADRATLAYVPLPAYLVNKVLDKLNPILDMSTMRFPVTLEVIGVKNGAVVIKGSAQFKPKLKD